MIEIKVPDLAESITEGTISQWLKKVGDTVHVGEPVVELETDKVNLEVNTDDAGVLQEILKQPGETVQVGEVIALLREGADEDATDKEMPVPSTQRAIEHPMEPRQEHPAQAEEKSVPLPMASPAARKMAREQGIALGHIQTADPMGRITIGDVKLNGNADRSTEIHRSQTPEQEKPVERIRMSRRRQTIANRLVEVRQTAAMLTTFNEVDMTAILDLRRRRKESFYEKHQVRLGFMSFFTKAVIGALKQFPLLNAEIQGEDILIKKFYDIGIAVAADEGLVVPVVHGADRLGFAEIERNIADLAQKARSNTLRLEDLLGGTFTITNGGVFGSLLSTPILNAPQVGILGMHTIQTRPVATSEEQMENRPMMYIALSYDHRIVDGHDAVRFLVKVKKLLEDPELLLLEG